VEITADRGYISSMTTAHQFPLSQLSVSEKVVLMELLWDDLSRSASARTSPSWHAVVLEQRRAAADSGEEEFCNWEDAKQRLRNRLDLSAAER
jgi:putative addiction module component (TIGR02574 family)